LSGSLQRREKRLLDLPAVYRKHSCCRLPTINNGQK
jgi:hypothetical protein